MKSLSKPRSVKNQKILIRQIKGLIEESKQQASIAVNTTMSMLYWNIGTRVNNEVLKDKRADYGKQIIITLCQQLESEYGSSFSEKNVRGMM